MPSYRVECVRPSWGNLERCQSGGVEWGDTSRLLLDCAIVSPHSVIFSLAKEKRCSSIPQHPDHLLQHHVGTVTHLFSLAAGLSSVAMTAGQAGETLGPTVERITGAMPSSDGGRADSQVHYRPEVTPAYGEGSMSLRCRPTRPTDGR